MNKCYYRIVWENYPSNKTPLNEQNLNKIDVATDEMDNRIISLDATKFDKSEAQLLVKYIEYDEDTGIFKITHYNDASYTIDTLLEKLAINFDYDYQTQRLIIELSDGTVKYVDLSALITQYEFLDSGTIVYTVHPDGKVTSAVKEGSIEEKHLRPNYLADIKVEVAKAQASQQAADASEKAAKASENAAKASQTAAKASEDAAAESADDAAASASTAVAKAEEAAASEENASAYAGTAEAYNVSAARNASNAAKHAGRAEEKANAASTSADNAASSAANADTYAKKSQSYAVGGTGTRDGEDADNSKYYAEKAKESADMAQEVAGGKFVPLSEKGANGGVATLDDTGKIPKAQLPEDIGQGDIALEYVNVFNSGSHGDNADVTVNDMAKNYFSMGMVKGEEDNPLGYADWAHVINMAWTPGSNANWISQIALGVAKGDGMWYRTTYDNIVGKPWKRLLDSSGGEIAGDLMVRRILKAGDKAWMWTDSEGGNIEIESPGPNKAIWQMNAFNGNFRLYSSKDNVNNTIFSISPYGLMQFFYDIDMAGRLRLPAGSHVHRTDAGQGSDGYIAFARIRIETSYCDCPIGFRIIQRGAPRDSLLYVRFSTIDHADPELSQFVCYGYYNDFYITKEAESTWKLYAYKGEIAWQSVDVMELIRPNYDNAGIEWLNEFYGTLPNGSIKAEVGKASMADAVQTYHDDNDQGGIGYGERYQLISKFNMEGGKFWFKILNNNAADARKYEVACDYSATAGGVVTPWQLYGDGTSDRLKAAVKADEIEMYFNYTSEGDGNDYWTKYKYNEICYHGAFSDTFEIKPDGDNSGKGWFILGSGSFTGSFFSPFVGDSSDLGGGSGGRWRNIYASSGTIQTSDRTKKKNIKPLDDDLTMKFFMGLIPSSYSMIDGTSGRTHWGLISQDIKELMDSIGMDSKDFAGFIKSPKVVYEETEEEAGAADGDENSTEKKRKRRKEKIVEGEYDYSLRYDEFIAPIIRMVQIQKDEIDGLKRENAGLKERLGRIEAALFG